MQGFDSFNPQTNFHDPNNVANQNGIVFFPGSVPLYKDVNGSGSPQLVGGLGVSGDGVDQDDDVTFQTAVGFEVPSNVLRADEVFVRGVRLPYQKFNRQPHEPNGQGTQKENPPGGIRQVLPEGRRRNLNAKNIQRIVNFRNHAISIFNGGSTAGQGPAAHP